MFFFFLTSDELPQYCGGLCTKQQNFSTTPSLLHNIKVSKSTHSHSLNNYGFQFGTPKKSLSNDMKIITQDRWIRNTVGVCTWAWDPRTGVCVVLSIEQGTWKSEVGPYHKYECMYLNEWMNEWKNEWISEQLSMLFECLDLWLPPVFKQGELALSQSHEINLVIVC